MKPSFLCLALVAAGCGGNGAQPARDLAMATGADLATASPDDLGAPPDLAEARDLAPPCAFLDGGTATELRCTGLYDDWPARHVDAANAPFQPAFELWADGAQKSRWIYLPAGQKIDVSDLNEWIFPVGTKLWKEFRLGAKRIETRLMRKVTAQSWDLQTYVWSDDQSTATLQTTPIVPFPGTASYEVPAGKCGACHDRRADKVLGFEAVLLAAPEATGLTFSALQAAGRLTSTNGNHLVMAGSLHLLDDTTRTVERNAVGYLHANCGVMCHKPGGGAPFSMRLTVDNTLKKTPDDTRSTVFYRMGQRDPIGGGGGQQMPPLDTHSVDGAGRQAIDDWIHYMTPANGYPIPSP